MAEEKAEAKYIYAKGRRKTSSVTLRFYEEKGKNLINDAPLEKVYPLKHTQIMVLKPFEVSGLNSKNFMFTAKTSGGGYSSQLGAVRLALARAIVKFDPDKKKPLKDAGLLTRDSRMVERKKPGLKKARKSEQYSKR